ncbi:FAD-dependent oxidoreductase [Nocardioides houyundeii]|uniref:FAD-dependent oxidoreductase n=1 Tax=Nocardioides houyundeii TaxID=2045452 RepID=UPI0013B386AB|nr:FAD-dependent oxidoreductase [Nocardioides houyundeii]
MATQTDVLVIGYGGGGAACALAARNAGASVIAIDSAERPGGNTVLSSGSIPAAGTASQAAAGIEDSPEWMAQDIVAQSGGHAHEDVVRALAESSAALMTWLGEAAGVDMQVSAGHRHVGHRVPRLHAPRGKNGADLMGAVAAANRAAGVDLASRHEASRLIVRAGAVVGAEVRETGADGPGEIISAGAVVLATGGFAGNREWLRRFCPQVVDAPYFGAEVSTGGALRLVEDLDVSVSALGSFSLHATVAHPSEILLTWTATENGGVLLDYQGRRFTDESAGYSSCGADTLDTVDGHAIAVFDERIYDQIAASPHFETLVAMGGVKRAASVEDLASTLGLPADNVAVSIASARHGTRLEAPFHAVRVRAGLLQTQGGIDVDGHARALARDGTPVSGLYAVGGAARGIAAAEGGRGYSSGSGLLTAVGLGYLAGLHSGRAARARS